MTTALLDEPVERFAGTPFGPLLLDRGCLFYYDGPLLYLGQAADGSVWLCETLNIDHQARFYKTMVIALTPEEAIFWRSQKTSEDFMEALGRLFQGERTRYAVVETWNEDDVVRVSECRPATLAEVADAAPRK